MSFTSRTTPIQLRPPPALGCVPNQLPSGPPPLPSPCSANLTPPHLMDLVKVARASVLLWRQARRTDGIDGPQ